MKNLLQFADFTSSLVMFISTDYSFSALALTKFVDLPFLPRYDFISLIYIVSQIFMLASKLERLMSSKLSVSFTSLV